MKDIDFNEILQHNDKLRNYQIEAKHNIFNEWQEGKKAVMLQMPTGTGKTRVFTSIIKDLWVYGFDRRDLIKTLVLAHRAELIEQIKENLYHSYGLPSGTIQGGHYQDEMYHIQVASVQTLSRDKRLNKWKDNEFDFIVIDEAHHTEAESYKKICNAFPNARILGVTATPYRLNKQPFTDVFDKLIISKSINEFIEEGFLSEYEYYSIEPTSKLQLDINNLKIDTTGDYSDKAMSNTLDNIKIRANVVDTYIKYAKDKKGIVYTINKDHNSNLCRQFNEKGFKAEAIDSDTPADRRKHLVDKFKEGSIKIICNVNIFSEGFDCPDIEFIQLARPTTSLALYLQQVGRGFRINEKKEKTLFLDNVGLYNRFGLPSRNRKWQHHFEGDENWDEKRDYNLETEDIHRVRYIEDMEDAHEDTEQIYSNVTEKEEMALCNIVAKLNINIDDALNLFKNKGFNLTPNSILTQGQYDLLTNSKKDTKNEMLSNIIMSVDKFICENEEKYKIAETYYNNKKYKRAVNYYVSAAYNGYPKAQYKLGLCYKRGHGMIKAYDQALYWFKKAAKGGNLDAQYRLGIFYENGYGTDKDEKEAVYWFKKAAEKYNAPSQYCLGLCYKNGIGIEKDIKEAVYWFDQSAQQKYPQAQRILDTIIKHHQMKELPGIEQSKMGYHNKIDNKTIESTIINYNNMTYDFDKITKKEAIELIVSLQDKIDINIVDTEKAKESLESIQKENEDKLMEAKIAKIDVDEDKLLEHLLRKKGLRDKIDISKKEQVNKDNQELINIETNNEENIFYLTRSGCYVKGVYNKNNNKFTILREGKIIKESSPSYVHKIFRDEKVKTVSFEQNGFLILKQDISFTSPSSAAEFCIGNTSNGWIEWKDKDGNTLNDIYRENKQLEAIAKNNITKEEILKNRKLQALKDKFNNN